MFCAQWVQSIAKYTAKLHTVMHNSARWQTDQSVIRSSKHKTKLEKQKLDIRIWTPKECFSEDSQLKIDAQIALQMNLTGQHCCPFSRGRRRTSAEGEEMVCVKWQQECVSVCASCHSEQINHSLGASVQVHIFFPEMMGVINNRHCTNTHHA